MVKFTSEEDDEPPLDGELDSILEEEEEILSQQKSDDSEANDSIGNYFIENHNSYLSSIDESCEDTADKGEGGYLDLDYNTFVLRYIMGEIDSEGLFTTSEEENVVPISIFIEYLGKRRISG